MYDELVKDLRENHDKYFARDMQAADAIEELTTNYDAATDIMKHQTEYIEELETNKPRWIPVTERLPEDLKFVLAVEDGIAFMAHCEHYYGEEEVFIEWHDTMYYPASPTHWMPLPEPPREE